MMRIQSGFSIAANSRTSERAREREKYHYFFYLLIYFQSKKKIENTTNACACLSKVACTNNGEREKKTARKRQNKRNPFRTHYCRRSVLRANSNHHDLRLRQKDCCTIHLFCASMEMHTRTSDAIKFCSARVCTVHDYRTSSPVSGDFTHWTLNHYLPAKLFSLCAGNALLF